jgi:phosphohistidine phosphatase
MRLYLIRHADAAPLGEGGVTDDHDRPLTELGHSQTRTLAAALQRRDVTLDQIVTSPLLRARQTAEDLRQAWKTPLRDVVLCDHLAPDGRRKKLSRFLRDLKADSVAAVGHMPDLSDYLTWLIGSRKAKVPVDKAGVACLECGPDLDRSDAVLLWLVTPTWCA